jgi:hypothetical protein
MAEQNLFQRLKKLFSTGVIIRHVGGKQLKVADTDYIQSYLSNAYKDRYSRIFSTAGLGNSWSNQYGLNMAYQTQRIMLFREYDIMDQDPIIHAALDIYADECTVNNEFGDILTIECEDQNIKEILTNLFYDILNVDFNLSPWVRNMCKYGDHFLFLEISEKYGIINVQPLSVYDTIRIEGEDLNNPRYTYFQTMGMNGQKTKLETYEVAHFRLMSDSNFLPYGRAAIEGARRVWKQLTLMEDAMLIHRIMRAPEKRVIKLDIGNIPPAEIDTYMQRISDKMKKVPFLDQNTGDYNLRYNMMNILEDFYIPVRGGDSGTEITNLGGLEFNSIEDIEYLRNRMMAALKIPKAFLGYDEMLNGKLTLAAEDVRFARTIERIQKIIVAELTKLAIVHLYSQGFEDEDLVNFSMKLTLPSTIYEQEKLNLWKEKVQTASDMKNLKMISEDWIYKQIFNMSDDETQKQRDGVAEDVKRGFRYMQLESGEPDPVKYGFPQDEAPQEPPMEGEPGAEGMPPEGGQPESGPVGEVGRPTLGMKYGQDSHPGGRDPLGFRGRYDAVKHSKERTRKKTRKSPFSMESMFQSLDKKFARSTPALLSEGLEVDKSDAGTFLDASKLEDDTEQRIDGE